jgi:activating signal cointegrator 1
MKAMSIQQPWVHAILREGKDIENRSWQRDFRDWIALHASGKPQIGSEFPRGIKYPDLDTLDYSAICGVARVVDIVTKSRSKWFNQPSPGYINYGWVLADITPLREPIECKGALQLWNVPPNILQSIKRELPKRIAAKI